MMLPNVTVAGARALRYVAVGLFLLVVPLLLAITLMGLWHFDLSLPITYNNGDATWQLVLSKMLFDTGWVLNNPYLGAPDVAHWHGNASAQTSAIHSILMRLIAPFVPDAITLQQVYFLLNFPLIATTSYLAARLIGVGRIFSCCVGLLYAFTTFRLSTYIYAFLANCFIIPLSIVPPIWILTGRLDGSIRRVLQSGTFWASVVICAMAAVTDGYYAFFTLLLLGFACGLRALTAGWLRSLFAPVLLIVVLMTTAYSLAWPLRQFERTHQAEFLVNGKPDPSVIKHPFEAEVYSSSLKLMLAPIANHRIPEIGKIGAWVLETSDHARAFPTGVRVQLGALASLLLIGSLIIAIARTSCASAWPFSSATARHAPEFGAILALVVFSFLCATSGGIGTLVALIYPTIRAYDRLTLFLGILLYFGAGLLLTRFFEVATPRRRALAAGLTLLIVPLAILDQSPNDLALRNPATLARFTAERKFIRTIESSVPAGTEIYQYPYSNYLIDSPYYGWGAFAHVRFYLHSRQLRWSNGAFKNSPVDKWHMRIAALPPGQLLTEVRATGFGGFLVDRTVVSDPEYDRVREVIESRTGMQPMVDEASRLAFWRLPPLGYHLVYGPDYLQPTAVIVDDPQAAMTENLSQTLDPMGFRAALHAAIASVPPGKSPNTPVVIERSTHPEAFTDMKLADAGLGLAPLQLPPVLQADVLCPAAAFSIPTDSVLTLTVHNRNPVSMRLNSGPVPIRVGLQQLTDRDGHQLRGDFGYRVPGSPVIPPGGSVDLTIPLSGLDLRTGVPSAVADVTAVFALVQEGVTWLGPTAGDQECRAALRLYAAKPD